MSELGPKAIACLRIAALPIISAERQELWNEEAAKYSAKALIVKSEQLTAKRYLDYGVSPAYCWLTEKGEEVLARALAG